MPPKKTTAFTMFLREFRVQNFANCPINDPSLIERARTEWQRMSEADQAHFEELAKQDTRRPQNQMSTLGEPLQTDDERRTHSREWRDAVRRLLIEHVRQAQTNTTFDIPFIVGFAKGLQRTNTLTRHSEFIPGEISLVKFSLRRGFQETLSLLPNLEIFMPPNEALINQEEMKSWLGLTASLVNTVNSGPEFCHKLFSFCTFQGNLLPIFTFDDFMKTLTSFIVFLEDNYSNCFPRLPPIFRVETRGYQEMAASLRGDPMSIRENESYHFYRGHRQLQVWPLDTLLSVLMCESTGDAQRLTVDTVKFGEASAAGILQRRFPISMPGPGACPDHMEQDSLVSCAQKQIFVSLYAFFTHLFELSSRFVPDLQEILPPAALAYIQQANEQAEQLEREEQMLQSMAVPQVERGAFLNHQHDVYKNFSNKEEKTDVKMDNRIRVPSFYDNF